MAFLALDDSPSDSRRPLHWAADGAALLVLFGATLSAWALAGVAMAMLLGLLAYTALSSDPARRGIALRCLITALLGALIAVIVALVR